jgi:hypothetical protein
VLEKLLAARAGLAHSGRRTFPAAHTVLVRSLQVVLQVYQMNSADLVQPFVDMHRRLFVSDRLETLTHAWQGSQVSSASH